MSRISGIDRRIIGKWIKDEHKILSSKKKRSCFKSKQSKEMCICPEMELQLKDWIVKEREKGVCISGFVIQKKALLLYNDIHPDEHHENFVEKCPLNKAIFLCEWPKKGSLFRGRQGSSLYKQAPE
ncbi:jerky homolog-like [Brachionus plicatilis]|uniref:Jerky homolog-like n=1 Tax=Brachionus plicatilis TaxID=10195 RepID=A0A3M7S079_BRAPC|nr:jerky homolog-like [Brachionus plicatilis]